MTTTRAISPEVSARAREARQDDRRDQLAESALATLGERGYAHTSLREIAANSPFSHGVVHYYFASKAELIVYCVRYYKAQCVTRYDGIVAEAASADALAVLFADKLVETLSGEAPMHRLWYDLRAQAMFEPELREAVLEINGTLEQMIWRVVSRYAELAGAEPALASHTCYAVLDGIFESALLGLVTGPASARAGVLEMLRREVLEVLPRLLRR